MSESPSAATPLAATSPRAPHRHRILVVDDDPDMLLLIGSALRHSTGFASEVFVTNTPEEALEKAEKQPFDIVVADYQMPKMNGLELLSEFRRRHPGVLRVLMTAHSTEQLALDAIRAAQVDTYLEKPFHPSLLIAVLQEVALRRDPLRVGAGLREERSEAALRLLAQLRASLEGVPPELAEVTLSVSFDSPIDLNGFVGDLSPSDEPRSVDVRYVGGRFQVHVLLRPEGDLLPVR